MRICFVCLGNICRSPAAEAVFVALAAQRCDLPALQVESAGTGPWHIGNPPHPHTLIEGERRGTVIDHVGQQFTSEDFHRFDVVIAMDAANVADLEALAPDGPARATIARFGSFAPGRTEAAGREPTEPTWRIRTVNRRRRSPRCSIRCTRPLAD